MKLMRLFILALGLAIPVGAAAEPATFVHRRLLDRAEASPGWAAADLPGKLQIVVDLAMKEPVTSDPVSDRYSLTLLGGPVDWVHFMNLARMALVGGERKELLYDQWVKEGGPDFEAGRGRTQPTAATPDDLPSNALGALFGEELRAAGTQVDLGQALETFIAPLQPAPDEVSRRQSHHRAVMGLSADPTPAERDRAYAWFTAEPLNLTRLLNAPSPAASGREALARAGFQVTRHKGKPVVIERIVPTARKP